MLLYFNLVGPDGSGKDTLINHLQTFLCKNRVLTFREPGGIPTAELIRDIILESNIELLKEKFELILKNKELNDYSVSLLKEAYKSYQNGRIDWMEVYLFSASRNETNLRIVNPSVEEGRDILGARSISCSAAYQGKARGIGIKRVIEINRPIMKYWPSFEIFLDVPVEVTLERINNRVEKKDRLDLESKKFHELTIEGYKEFHSMNYFPVYYLSEDLNLEEKIRIFKRIYNKHKHFVPDAELNNFMYLKNA